LTILPARGELGALLRRPAGLQATIDQVAMPPPVQARFGDPNEAATSRTVRPDLTRSRARRRNSGGYGLGTGCSLGLPGTSRLPTRTSAKPGQDQCPRYEGKPLATKDR